VSFCPRSPFHQSAHFFQKWLEMPQFEKFSAFG